MTDELVAVGRIGPPRGVRGEVFVEPWTDEPAERFAPGTRLRTASAVISELVVDASSTGGGRLVVHFAGVDDREQAQGLRGIELLIAATERPPLTDPDEFYVSSLVGLQASTVDGRDLGPVHDVVNVAGADYLIVAVDGHERLVPFVEAIVPTVDIEARRIVIDPPQGLFEL